MTNTPKDREEMARAFIAKSVYNIQTTRDLIDRLRVDRTLRMLCGWEYSNKIPSEAKFSRVFKEFTDLQIAQKTQEQFVAKYLSDVIFLYNATDATKVLTERKTYQSRKREREAQAQTWKT
ncbi:MAG: transposase [Sulfurovum sp.]|nr:transposase [Sulfurovum sp.]MDQ7046902.1 transposase [Sulfurovum sp.]